MVGNDRPKAATKTLPPWGGSGGGGGLTSQARVAMCASTPPSRPLREAGVTPKGVHLFDPNPQGVTDRFHLGPDCATRDVMVIHTEISRGEEA